MYKIFVSFQIFRLLSDNTYLSTSYEFRFLHC